MPEQAAEEIEPPPPPERARRPVLGQRHGNADRLLRQFATHELATIRAVAWYSSMCAGFSHIIKRGRSYPADVLAEIQHTADAWMMLKSRRRNRRHVLWLEAVYFEGEHIGIESWRLGLEAFARVLEEGDRMREPQNPL